MLTVLHHVYSGSMSIVPNEVYSGSMPIVRNRVARLAFLTPNFTNLPFFRSNWRQKNGFTFSFQYLAFLEAVGTYYQTGVLYF